MQMEQLVEEVRMKGICSFRTKPVQDRQTGSFSTGFLLCAIIERRPASTVITLVSEKNRARPGDFCELNLFSQKVDAAAMMTAIQFPAG
jgi:hypothetical protein